MLSNEKMENGNKNMFALYISACKNRDKYFIRCVICLIFKYNLYSQLLWNVISKIMRIFAMVSVIILCNHGGIYKFIISSDCYQIIFYIYIILYIYIFLVVAEFIWYIIDILTCKHIYVICIPEIFYRGVDNRKYTINFNGIDSQCYPFPSCIQVVDKVFQWDRQ